MKTSNFTYAHFLEVTEIVGPITHSRIEDLNQEAIQLGINALQLSINDTPQVKLKPLLAKLRYAYLRPISTYPVIINTNLNVEQRDKLVWLLREHKK